MHICSELLSNGHSRAYVLVARNDIALGRYPLLRLSLTLTPEMIEKWVIRILYMQIFIVLMATMGYWHKPFVFGFVGGLVVLAITGIMYASEPVQKEVSR
jgi:hypothetical protein